MTELSHRPSEVQLDYFGVHPECGCISAWMSAGYSTQAQIRDFYRSMADTGREVRRMEFTEDLRARIDRCPHIDQRGEQR